MGIENDGFDDDVEFTIPSEVQKELDDFSFNRMLNSIITMDNSHNENQRAEEAINILLELWIDSALVMCAFRKWLTAQAVIALDEKQKDMFLEAVQALDSKQKVVTWTWAFRRRHKMEDWAFEMFIATVEMLNNQVLKKSH